MASISRSMLLSLLLLLAASVALAQVWPPLPDPAPSWGVTDETALIVSSFEMVPYAHGVVINTLWGTAYRYVASATAQPVAVLPLDLPRGAVITRIEVAGCNHDSSTAAHVELNRYEGDIAYVVTQAELPAAAGCGQFSSDPIAYDVGFGGAHGILWLPSVLGTTQRIELVRVYYKLQVSPAPGTATFADVAVGSALHQYVEALVAAGITAGCGDGNYCPNAPVTRGQMAVFLAKALGLHWAP